MQIIKILLTMSKEVVKLTILLMLLAISKVLMLVVAKITEIRHKVFLLTKEDITLFNKSDKGKRLQALELFLFATYGFYVPVLGGSGDSNSKGFFRHDNVIFINLDFEFKSDKEILLTLIHEGRHAWQLNNGLMDVFPIYDADDNYKSYYNSVLEKDARNAEKYFKNKKPITTVSPYLEKELIKIGREDILYKIK